MTDCKKCSKEESGYYSGCIDCCARLVMSCGRKGDNRELNYIIEQQRSMMFYALETFKNAPKRKDIVAHIKMKYSTESVN